MTSTRYEHYSKEDWRRCMSKVQQGDKQAYAAIFYYFSPRLKHFTYKQLGSEQIAIEVVQETMTTVWHKAALFDGCKSSLSTWIFTIARNQCYDHLRKYGGKEIAISSEDIWSLLPDEDNVAHYTPEQERLKQQVIAFLEELPDGQRQVMQAVFIDDMPHQQVADMLDIPVGTVKSRIRLAVEKMKLQLDSESL